MTDPAAAPHDTRNSSPRIGRTPRGLRALALAAAAALAVVARPAAQAVAPAPPTAGVGAAMHARIVELTAPGMDGRTTGSEGGAKARAYIEAALRRTSVLPATGSRSPSPRRPRRARR